MWAMAERLRRANVRIEQLEENLTRARRGRSRADTAARAAAKKLADVEAAGVKLERSRVAPLKRIAVNKSDAAQVLGVSVDFFDSHLAGEILCTYRGRRRMYRVAELERWLERSGEQPGLPSTHE